MHSEKNYAFRENQYIKLYAIKVIFMLNAIHLSFYVYVFFVKH